MLTEAYGKDHCPRCRDNERVAAGAGTGEPEESLGCTCSTSLNRLVQTRMPGGVGRAVRDGRLPDLSEIPKRFDWRKIAFYGNYESQAKESAC